MISPETRPRPSIFAVYSMASKKPSWPRVARLSGAQPREVLGILELVAEGEVVGAGLDQRVVLAELPPRHRHGLDADESADLPAQRADERLALPQAVDRLEAVHLLEVVAGVEVSEDRARFVPGRARHLDHVVDFLARLFRHADVRPVVQNLQAREGDVAQ